MAWFAGIFIWAQAQSVRARIIIQKKDALISSASCDIRRTGQQRFR
jgi:hypothetical protein